MNPTQRSSAAALCNCGNNRARHFMLEKGRVLPAPASGGLVEKLVFYYQQSRP